jgi:hypothetical protein
LDAGTTEISIGATVADGDAIDGTVVGQLAHGITDRIEVGGIFENTHLMGLVRIGVLKTEENGFALSILGGGGVSALSYYVGTAPDGSNQLDELRGGSFALGMTVGKNFGFFEPYGGFRWVKVPNLSDTIYSLVFGSRLNFSENVGLIFDFGYLRRESDRRLDLDDGILGYSMSFLQGSLGMSFRF